MKNANEPLTRLYYLDWLRVLAMFGVFFYHNARFFDGLTDWHIKNNTTNQAATVYVGFADQWGMPLFFLLAGAGAYFAFKVIKPWQYVQERILRLVIPLIFGMLVIVVPQAYFEAIHHGTALNGNFFQLYVQYLKTLPDLNWYHLWFLEQLFIFSIISLPLMVPLGRMKQSIASTVARIFDRTWALSLIVILTFVVNAFVYPDGFWGTHTWSGWNIINNLLFFILGYLFLANEHIIDNVKKIGWGTLFLGIAAIIYLFTFVDELSNPSDYYGTSRYILSQFVQSVNAWCWLFTILSLASRFLTGTNRFLRYANEAVLPFYILHQTIIIVIGFYIVQWNTGIGLKYLVISSTSFIGIMAIYELLVRRFNIMRFLFGMRLKRKTPIPD